MAEPLIGLFRDYRGNCDYCGAEVNEPILLVSDLKTKDRFGNRLFLAIGVPVDAKNYIEGIPLVCKECGGRALILRLYESTDVTDLVINEEARHAL